VIPVQFEEAEDFSEGVAAVKVNGKWGYSDKSGKMVIAPTFETASTFSEGLARVEIATAWGYINNRGKFVVRPQFTLAYDFSEGLAPVLVCRGWSAEGAASVSQSEGCAWGFINKECELVIQAKFRQARPFSEGLAAVWDGRNWGFIDKAGNVVIPLQFDCNEIGRFRKGLALVRAAGGVDAAVILHEGRILASSGYIDRSGKWVIRSRLHYWFEDDFSDGLVRVATSPKKTKNCGYEWRYGFFDWSRKLSVRPRFDYAGSFCEGLAAARVDQRCGYIDKRGRFVINLKFAWCGDFSEGFAPVRVVTTK
jgi:hypothetical protein